MKTATMMVLVAAMSATSVYAATPVNAATPAAAGDKALPAKAMAACAGMQQADKAGGVAADKAGMDCPKEGMSAEHMEQMHQHMKEMHGDKGGMMGKDGMMGKGGVAVPAAAADAPVAPPAAEVDHEKHHPK